MNFFKKLFGQQEGETSKPEQSVHTTKTSEQQVVPSPNPVSQPREIVYDKFTPHQIFQQALQFSFRPDRYEVWAKGQLLDKGNISGTVQCIPSFMDMKRSEVKNDLPAKLNLRHTLIFDQTYTSTDRIFLATVPAKSNIDNYDSFQLLRQSVPLDFPIITRPERDFDENEPYVCCLYFENKRVAKVTFSFGNNPRLLELYSDTVHSTTPNKISGIAKVLVEKLIEDWDDDGAWVGEDGVTETVEELYGFRPTKDDYRTVVATLNKFNEGGDNVVDHELNDMGFSKSMVFKSRAPRSMLRNILSNL